MKLAMGVALLLIGLSVLHLTRVGILVWQGEVEDLGEGDPAFSCFYMSTVGLVRIGYFFDERPGQDKKKPAGRSDCRRFCMIEQDVFLVGKRRLTAWRCASDELAH